MLFGMWAYSKNRTDKESNIVICYLPIVRSEDERSRR